MVRIRIRIQGGLSGGILPKKSKRFIYCVIRQKIGFAFGKLSDMPHLLNKHLNSRYSLTPWLRDPVRKKIRIRDPD
jgi:hypothetical protein